MTSAKYLEEVRNNNVMNLVLIFLKPSFLICNLHNFLFN